MPPPPPPPLQQQLGASPVMSFEEASLERSKGFVNALQELKSLRPQLYSAAEYCEKSHLHSEQKQMVLDNLKDYAVRALVNTVDHLGTVAYKLNDLFEQQVADVVTVELKVTCLNQQILTWQMYMDLEGLREQQMFITIPRHHKHYILPSSYVNQKSRSSPHVQPDTQPNHIHAQPHPYPSGISASKPLFWHLASEGPSASTEQSSEIISITDPGASKITSKAFHFMDMERSTVPQPLPTNLRPTRATPVIMQAFTAKESSDIPNTLSAFPSSGNPGRCQINQPSRGKKVFGAFFAKNKTSKQKKT